MGLAARVAGLTTAFALLAGGGYVIADINDVVPGFLTNAPVPAPAAPFPVAAGAVQGADPAEPLAELDPSAPVADGERVAALVDDFLDHEDLIGNAVSVLLVDALTGEEIAGHAPDDARVPASTAKIFTAAAAMASPGADVTLDTTVVQSSPGEIYLVGGGDMMLAAGEGNPGLVNGRAGLGDLAAQVAAALALTGDLEVSLRVDESLFSGPGIAPGWAEHDPLQRYAAPITPLAVNIANPAASGYDERRYDQPGLQAAAVFAAELAEVGVTVTGPVGTATAPSDARVLGTVSSAPLGEVVRYFLQTSDNTITEVVGRIVALDAGLPGSFDGATSAVRAAVQRLGVDVSDVHLADCSGLSDGSSLTPRALTELVRTVIDPAQPRLRVVARDLPVAGLSGTLDDRFLGSPARGLVRAKTGSLPQVTALAGTLVTADERLVVFAVMIDAAPEGGAWGARATVDRFVTAVAECGC